METVYMERALELAARGEGRVSPNPLVGAVIVKENRIIGEGWHEVYGGPHAEVNAVRNATADVSGATLYVTLEPCSHYGKTPPCAELIIGKGFARVVIAMADPNPLVAGQGIKMLCEAGIQVEVGLLGQGAARQNEVFLKYIVEKEPFVILKTAMTLDGKIATAQGKSKWITGPESRQYVHRLRNKVAGIMAGIGTVLTDDPSLTARVPEGVDPVRIIVDSSLRIPLTAKVLNLPGHTIIATTRQSDPAKREILDTSGSAKVILADGPDGRVDLKFLMKQLGAQGIDSVLLEGGAELNWSMLKAGLVDRVMMFIAPKILGGARAVTPVGGDGFADLDLALELEDLSVQHFGADTLIEGCIKQGGNNVHRTN